VGFNPAYSVYHNSEFDFMSLGVSPFVSTTWRDTDFSTSYDYSEFSGLLSEQKVNTSHAFSTDASRRFKLPALLPFLAGEEERVAAPTGVRVALDYRMFKSVSSPAFDANSWSFSTLLNQALGQGWSWSLSYSLRNNENTDSRGDDFAYLGHTGNIQVTKALGPGWSTTGGYGLTFLDYKHPASVSVEGEQRQNIQHSLSMSMSYFINRKLRVFGSYSYQIQDSNLPVIAIIPTEDAAINQIIGTSPSLGDFQRHNISVGMGINF
jgi:lipopolysaccharide assembly outer membrane protein LptD (OstA)